MVKFSVYLNRILFVMIGRNGRAHMSEGNVFWRISFTGVEYFLEVSRMTLLMSTTPYCLRGKIRKINNNFMLKKKSYYLEICLCELLGEKVAYHTWTGNRQIRQRICLVWCFFTTRLYVRKPGWPYTSVFRHRNSLPCLFKKWNTPSWLYVDM